MMADFLAQAGWWFIAVSTAAMTFLIMLNGYVRNRNREIIDAATGAAMLVLVILSVIFFGWLAFAALIVLALIFGAIMIPFAARLAKRLKNQN